MHKVKVVHPNDVLINAPPAEFRLIGSNSKELEQMAKTVIPGLDIDSKDIIQMQQAAIRGVESDLQKTRMVTASIANACLCLYKMLLDSGYADEDQRVIFPKELVERMNGQKISIGEDGFGNRFVRVQDRFDHPTWEGREEDV
jgi:hypothetical protein